MDANPTFQEEPIDEGAAATEAQSLTGDYSAKPLVGPYSQPRANRHF
jgi:hypothetical protein